MGLSLGHLVILGIIVLLFGTRRLPEIGSALGRSARAFREALEKKDGEAEGKLERKD